MAIIKFVKVKKGNLKKAIDYITNKDKTTKDLIYCKDCDFNNVVQQFTYIKKLYSKTGGRQYYHFIQSFSPNDKITYELANKIGQELCKYFKGYQIIMATHKDKDYVHNHFIMNSVNFETGKKYQQSAKDLEKIKELSNMLCKENNLRQINLNNSKVTKYLKSGEYHLSKKEELEKQKLISTINKCIKISKSKKQFIYNMNLLGYKVKWQDNRKYITFTTPNNIKFRDKRLLNVKYTKERLEHYFNRIDKRFITYIGKSKKQNSNIQNKTFKKIYNEDFSDIAKKDYLKSIENASAIEWE